MKASVEISMYPLQRDYKEPILDFIARLNAYPDLTVRTNTMSTQVFGPYATLMEALTREMKVSFEKDPTVIMVMKVINMDLR